MKLLIDQDEETIAAEDTSFTASSSELLEVEYKVKGSVKRLTGSDVLKVTMKPKDDRSAGAEVFVGTLGPADFHENTQTYRKTVNFVTDPMLALFTAATLAQLAVDVKFIPTSGAPFTSPGLILTANQPVSHDDDGSPAVIENAYDKFVAADQVQSLSPTAQRRALANQGVIVGNNEVTFLCPDGVTRRLQLLNPDS